MAGNVVSNVKKYYGGQVPVPGQGDSDGKVKVLVEKTTTMEIEGVQTDVDLLYDADDLTVPVTPQKLGQWTDENYLIVFKAKDADGKVRGFILYELETTSTSTDTLVNNAVFVALKGLEIDPGASAFVFTMVEDSATLSRYLQDENGELTVKFNLSSVEPGAQSGHLYDLIGTDSPYMDFEIVRDDEDHAYLNLNADGLDDELEGMKEHLDVIEGILDELPSDEHGYFNSSLVTTPGDGTTESLVIDNFRISEGRSVHGNNIEFVQTHQEGGVDFGEVYLNPGTYILNVHYTLQWVGNPRGTFLPLVANVGEQPFDFSYEHEDILRSTRIVTRTTRGKFGLNFPFDADTPSMGIWVKYLEIAQIASYNHPAVTHDSTLAGSGQIGDPLGVTPAAFGKVKDIPTSISQFRTGDVIPVDGPNGPAKMAKDALKIDLDQTATTVTMTGNGGAAVYSETFFCKKNTLYNVTVSNPTWNASSTSSASNKIAIVGVDSAGNTTNLYNLQRDSFVPAHIYFSTADYSVLYLFFRGNVGESVTFTFEPLTEFVFGNSCGTSIKLYGNDHNVTFCKFGCISPSVLWIYTPNPNWSRENLASGEAYFVVNYYFSNKTPYTIVSYTKGDENVLDNMTRIDVPSGATHVSVHIRGDSGTVVDFNLFVAPGMPVTLGGDSVHSFKITGRGGVAIDSEKVNVVPGTRLILKPSNPSWAVTSLTSASLNKLIFRCYDGDGVSTRLAQYQRDDAVPDMIVCSVPANGKSVDLFVRADVGELISFELFVSAPPVINENPPLGTYSHTKTTLNGYNQNFGSFDFEAVAPSSINIVPSKTSWSVDNVGSGSNVFILQYKDSDGVYHDYVHYLKGSRIPSIIKSDCPNGATGMRILIRADIGESVDFDIWCSAPATAIDENALDKEDLMRAAQNKLRRGTTLPQFGLVSDPHASRDGMQNAVKWFGELNDSVGFMILLGDICPDSPMDFGAYTAYNEMIQNSSTIILPVIGNHDKGSSYYVGHFAPSSVVVNNVMGPAISKGYIPSTSTGYYYKDFPSDRLRIIILNLYENEGNLEPDSLWERVAYDSQAPQIALNTTYASGTVVNIGEWTDYSYRAKETVTTPSAVPYGIDHSLPCFDGVSRPDHANIHQTQAQWLADTLLSVPSNYSVVIAGHTSYSTMMSKVDCKFTADIQSDEQMKNSFVVKLGNGVDVIADIINKFINGQDDTLTYSRGDETITVSCNFSAKNNDVKYIGYMTGHLHYDAVTRHSVYTNQYAVHASASGLGNSPWTDLQNINKPTLKYSDYTLVAPNHSDGAVNLIKVGLKMTDSGYIRDCARITQSD